jgi:NADPH-dependent ferric siderophore reductase
VVDVDLALHGDDGLASRWASAAELGAEATLLGPDSRYDGEHGGVEWRPATGARRLLLAGDETAVPAALGILERVPRDAVGEALLEVPSSADALDHAAPPGVAVTWLARDGAVHGELLVPAVAAVAARLLRGARDGVGAGTVLEDVDVDRDLLWEVPDEATGAGGCYAWVAAEAGVVRDLRRLLLTGHGLDRGSAAFMGYWRRGRSDGE